MLVKIPLTHELTDENGQKNAVHFLHENCSELPNQALVFTYISVMLGLTDRSDFSLVND